MIYLGADLRSARPGHRSKEPLPRGPHLSPSFIRPSSAFRAMPIHAINLSSAPVRRLAASRRSLVAAVFTSVLLAGCASTDTRPQAAAPAVFTDPAVVAEAAKQAELAIRQEAMEYSRLQSVFWPIARAARPLCPTRFSGSIGPAPSSLIGIRESLRPIMRRILGTDERLTFTEIVDGTPAERAGVRAGDILTAIDGVQLPVSKDALRLYFERVHGAAQKGAALELQLERQGTGLKLTVPVEQVCAVIALPVPTDNVSAFAAGRGVFVTRGMMRFANDRELAIVVAHEIAHIALGHTLRDKSDGAANPAAHGADIAADCVSCGTTPVRPAPAAEPSRLMQQSRELDADVVGAYLAAAAGLPVGDAANFWRRIAASYPATIQSSHLRTHPASPERFVELERAVADVEQRQSSSQSLVARLKSGKLTSAMPRIKPAGPWNVTMISDRYVSPIAASPSPATGAPGPALSVPSAVARNADPVPR